MRFVRVVASLLLSALAALPSLANGSNNSAPEVLTSHTSIGAHVSAQNQSSVVVGRQRGVRIWRPVVTAAPAKMFAPESQIDVVADVSADIRPEAYAVYGGRAGFGVPGLSKPVFNKPVFGGRGLGVTHGLRKFHRADVQHLGRSRSHVYGGLSDNRFGPRSARNGRPVVHVMQPYAGSYGRPSVGFGRSGSRPRIARPNIVVHVEMGQPRMAGVGGVGPHVGGRPVVSQGFAGPRLAGARFAGPRMAGPRMGGARVGGFR